MGISLHEDEFKRGNNYLFAIGINRYVFCSPLSNPVKDIQALIEVLTKKYNFKQNHIITLFDQQATRSAILGEFKKLIKKLKSDDNLIIYYAGHGYFDEDFEEGFWLTVNSKIIDERLDLDQAIPNNFLKQILRKIRARHIFLVSDSCFSGSFFVKERQIAATREERFPSRWGLTSGRNEPVSDGKAGENSPFANSLITYLRNTNKQILTVSDIITHVKKGTTANSSQTPIGSPIEGVGHQNGAFLLRLKISEEQLWKSASTQNTVAAYMDYMENYPIGKGKYRLEAQRHIQVLSRQLQQTSLWEEISGNPSIKGLIEFLREYPKGKYSSTAKKMLDSLEKQLLEKEKKAWFITLKKNTEEAFHGHLKDFPHGFFQKEAVKRLADIRLKVRMELMNKEYHSYFSQESINLVSFEKENEAEIRRIIPDQKDYEENEMLINGLLESMMNDNRELEHLASKLVNEGYANKNKVKHTILKQFPILIGEQIRGLFAHSLKAKDDSKNEHLPRLHQLHFTYHKTVQFFCFVMMAELWDEKLAGKVVLFGEKLKEPLQAYLETNEYNLRAYNYNRLLISLIYQKGITQSPFFLSEIENLKEDESFKVALDFFRVLGEALDKETIDSENLFRLTVLGEYYLTILLSKVSFITTYNLAAIGDVSIGEFGRDLVYRLQYTDLKVSLDGYQYMEEERSTSFVLPPHSLILFKSLDEQKFLRLSPFIFNQNSKSTAEFVKLYVLEFYEDNYQVFQFISSWYSRSKEQDIIKTKIVDHKPTLSSATKDPLHEIREKLNEFRALFDENYRQREDENLLL